MGHRVRGDLDHRCPPMPPSCEGSCQTLSRKGRGALGPGSNVAREGRVDSAEVWVGASLVGSVLGRIRGGRWDWVDCSAPQVSEWDEWEAETVTFSSRLAQTRSTTCQPKGSRRHGSARRKTRSSWRSCTCGSRRKPDTVHPYECSPLTTKPNIFMPHFGHRAFQYSRATSRNHSASSLWSKLHDCDSSRPLPSTVQTRREMIDTRTFSASNPKSVPPSLKLRIPDDRRGTPCGCPPTLHRSSAESSRHPPVRSCPSNGRRTVAPFGGATTRVAPTSRSTATTRWAPLMDNPRPVFSPDHAGGPPVGDFFS